MHIFKLIEIYLYFNSPKLNILLMFVCHGIIVPWWSKNENCTHYEWLQREH